VTAKDLAQKLGIKPEQRIALVGAPEGYAGSLEKMVPGVRLSNSLEGPLDFIQLFARSRSELEESFPRLAAKLGESGMIWVSWPKRSSGIESDLREDVVRDTGLAGGLVDVKVASIDDEWSALKFVFRLKDRREAGRRT
jgi:hypothetical protein